MVNNREEDRDYSLVVLAKHLADFDKIDQLIELLGNYLFLQAKITHLGPEALIDDLMYPEQLVVRREALSDLSHINSDVQCLGLIKDVVQLTSHHLERHPDFFPCQIYGRLLSVEKPLVQRLLKQITSVTTLPWIRPITHNLEQPGISPLLRTIDGPTAFVISVKLLPGEEQCLSLSYDGFLRIWELKSGSLFRALAGKSVSMNALEVSRDGKYCITSSYEKAPLLWDLNEGKHLHEIGDYGKGNNSIAVTSDWQNVLISSDDRPITMYNILSASKVRTFPDDLDQILGVIKDVDGHELLAATHRDKETYSFTAYPLDSDMAPRHFAGHEKKINAIALAADQCTLVSAADDNYLKLWNVRTGEELKTLVGHEDNVYCVTTTHDSRIVSGASDGSIKVWALESGAELATFHGHSEIVSDIAVSELGDFAVSASFDKTLKVWNLRELSNATKAENNTGKHLDAFFWGSRCFSISRYPDNSFKVWDIENNETILFIEARQEQIVMTAIDKARKRVLVEFDNGEIIISNLSTGKYYSAFISNDSKKSYGSSIVAADGKIFAKYIHDSLDTLCVLDLDSGSVSGSENILLTKITGIDCEACASDAARFVTLSQQHNPKKCTLRVWDLNRLEELKSTVPLSTYVSRLAVSADGKRVVAGCQSGAILLWEPDQDNELTSIPQGDTLEDKDASFTQILITMDSKYAVSACLMSNEIKVWDLQNKKLIHIFCEHTNWTNDIALTSDGRRVISSSEDCTLLIWDLQTGDHVAGFCLDSHVYLLEVDPLGHNIVAQEVGSERSSRIHLLSLEEKSETGMPSSANTDEEAQAASATIINISENDITQHHMRIAATNRQQNTELEHPVTRHPIRNAAFWCVLVLGLWYGWQGWQAKDVSLWFSLPAGALGGLLGIVIFAHLSTILPKYKKTYNVASINSDITWSSMTLLLLGLSVAISGYLGYRYWYIFFLPGLALIVWGGVSILVVSERVAFLPNCIIYLCLVLARWCRATERLERAISICCFALSLKRKTQVMDDNAMASILYTLAAYFFQDGDYENAESAYLQALPIVEKVRGQGHADTAHILFSLALINRIKENNHDALPLWERALKAYQKIQRATDLVNSVMMCNMAVCYNNLAFYKDVPQKNWENAQAYYREAIGLFKRSKAPIEAANAELNLQIMYRLSGQTDNSDKIEELTLILESNNDPRAEKGRNILM